MPHFKDKLQVFIMGLMLGLLIGGGFFILKLDDYFKELNFYKRISAKQEVKPEVKPEAQPVAEVKTNSTGKSTYRYPAKDRSIDSLYKATDAMMSRADSLLRIDSIRTHSVAIAGAEDEIVVKKDEMIASEQADLINLSNVQTNNKDSLLQKVSGIRDDKSVIKQAMSIEFWRSPLNYKGYKMAKNKVVLFGITEQEEVKLYKLDETIYIKLQQGVYKLDYTNEFKQFERINDETVLARLK